MPIDSAPCNALLIQLEGTRKEQKWTPEILEGLINFVRCTENQEGEAESNKALVRAHDLMRRAVAAYGQVKTIPTDLASRLTTLQYDLMGQKPPELSWLQWRIWNLAPFFSAKKWPSCKFFLEALEVKPQVSADAVKVAYLRMRREHGSLPLDSQIAILLDRMAGRRKRSRLSILTNRSAYPHLRLALRRNNLS